MDKMSNFTLLPVNNLNYDDLWSEDRSGSNNLVPSEIRSQHLQYIILGAIPLQWFGQYQTSYSEATFPNTRLRVGVSKKIHLVPELWKNCSCWLLQESYNDIPVCVLPMLGTSVSGLHTIHEWINTWLQGNSYLLLAVSVEQDHNKQ